jgi:hypothetical protein
MRQRANSGSSAAEIFARADTLQGVAGLSNLENGMSCATYPVGESSGVVEAIREPSGRFRTVVIVRLNRADFVSSSNFISRYRVYMFAATSFTDVSHKSRWTGSPAW